MLRPDTGYLVLGADARMLFCCCCCCVEGVVETLEGALPLAGLLLLPVFVVPILGCLGITKARVCLSSERSCMRAEISGRSRFLLFSRRVLISMEVLLVCSVLKSKSGYCLRIWACSLALGPGGFVGVGFAGTSGGFSTVTALAAGGVCFSGLGSGIGGFRVAFLVSYGGGGGGGRRRILGVLSTEFRMLSSERDRTNIDDELLDTGRGRRGGGGGGSYDEQRLAIEGL